VTKAQRDILSSTLLALGAIAGAVTGTLVWGILSHAFSTGKIDRETLMPGLLFVVAPLLAVTIGLVGAGLYVRAGE